MTSFESEIRQTTPEPLPARPVDPVVEGRVNFARASGITNERIIEDFETVIAQAGPNADTHLIEGMRVKIEELRGGTNE